MRRIERWFTGTLLTGLVAVSFVTAPAAVAGKYSDEVSQLDQGLGEGVAEVEELLEPVDAITSAIPVDPQEALIDVTAALSADVGFPQDPSAQIRLAQLPDEVAGRLANVLTVMRDCNAITQTHFAEVAPNLEQIATDGGGLDPAQFSDIRECAQRMWAATGELELTLEEDRSHPIVFGCVHQPHDDPKPPPLEDEVQGVVNTIASIDVWPVLRFDALCDSNTYVNDYLLTVDLGGADTYANNAGSNMVDLNYAPVTSGVRGARGFGPARGCQQAIAGLRQGDCVPAVAAVVDLRDGDRYGVLESPDLDGRCTPPTSQLVRRMVTGGVGFLGVGILRDVDDQSADYYTSKTVSLGAGHIFGVGVLSDGGGNDSYLSVRNSQGFALVGGVGILADQAGGDRYDYYMPPASNPSAPNQSPGAGGVLDDEPRDPNSLPPDFLGECDRMPRFTQGTGNVTPGSLGILVDFAGNDSYRGAFGEFTAPGQVPPLEGNVAGSMGFGANGGAGVFLDLGAGFDTYTTDAPVGTAPLRWNDLVLLPRSRSTGNGGAGLFVDR